MDESHSDINAAFGPHRSVSAQFGDHHLVSSLLEIKNDLSTEVRALTKRMSHIDEQISQIFHFLSSENALANAATPDERKSSISPPLPPTQIPSPVAPLSPLIAPPSPEANNNLVSMSPLFEAPSFYSDLGTKSALFASNQLSATATDVHEFFRESKTGDSNVGTSAERRVSAIETSTLSTLPASVYNRSSSSSITSLGISSTSRSSVSNKIAPAPALSSPVSPKNPSSVTFQPISNTRFNPGRSPKPKSRSYQSRTVTNKLQPYAEKSTVIEMEPVSSQELTNKTSPLLGASSKTTSALSTKPSSSVFRRFMAGGNNADKPAASSAVLLYPRTSDDERPTSPISSGNEDDDYRPLTSSSKHHQTLL